MQFLSQIPISATSHWVDGILFCILLFYGIEGLISGAVYAFFDLLKFVASFLSGILFYILLGGVLINILSIPKGFANVLAFFIVAFFTELMLHLLLRKPTKIVNDNIQSSSSFGKKLNNFFGIIPGLLSGMVLVMFIVTVLVALPFSLFLKHSITNSNLGSFFAERSEILQKNIAGIFGGAAENTLNFLTVEPKSNSIVSLGFTSKQGVIDSASEQQMLNMVNAERQKRNIPPVNPTNELQSLARNYADEMVARGYFSHYTPEGLSPFDRMNQAKIPYIYAGENLAFSVNIQLAMQGLMESQGHRENILSTNYHKVGIGVIDAGIYGEMFVQEFTD